MEVLGVLLVLALVFGPIILAIMAYVRSGRLEASNEQLIKQVNALESEVSRIRRRLETAAAPTAAPTSEVQPTAAEPAPVPILPVIAPISVNFTVPPLPPPDRPVVPEPTGTQAAEQIETPAAPSAPALPPPIPAAPKPPLKPPLKPAPPVINWEQFVGAKLYAWLGGLALALGLALLIKYSFENNWIPPELRVAFGFLAGIGLLVGGMRMRKKEYAVTSQTLCATGILVLYASTFAARAYYQFPFFGPLPTLILMSLITAVAFILAVCLEAQVVAILGILGGFLTPALLSTGQDNPSGLFGYIALLNLGLLAVTLHRQWNYLVPLGAGLTALTQIVWAAKFFVVGQYFEGHRVLIPMAVVLGFVALYTVGTGLAFYRERKTLYFSGSALFLALVGIGFAWTFLTFAPLANRPLLVFSFVFALDLLVLALVWLDPKKAIVQPAAGWIAFALLAGWTTHSLHPDQLNSALAIYLVFTLFHCAIPLVLQHLRQLALPGWLSQSFPIIALLMALGPMFSTTELSYLIWPFILIVDVLAIVLAVLSAALLPVLIVLVLTLLIAGALLAKIPATLTGLPTVLIMLGFFSVFFALASVWAVRRLARNLPKQSPNPGTNDLLEILARPEAMAAILPGSSVALPFLLLIMASARLPMLNPSPIFGLALLLIVLLLGLSKFLRLGALPLIGLFSTVALEFAWHLNHFTPDYAGISLAWYVNFYAAFTGFPFLFRKAYGTRVLPWAAAALAGPLQFFLIVRLVGQAYPNPLMGLVPAMFVLPSLAGLILLLKKAPSHEPARNAQLAWFGGVVLFFITIIFPVQFDRQWITLGWALEGAALCWLSGRIPHRGLPRVGVALLVVAFCRLAFNPAVLSYHPRSETALFNWYLYAYGLVSVALFLGARWLVAPMDQIRGRNVRPILQSLGTILAFILVNLEIADYFTAPGAPVVTLQFSGNVARDMSYSIAWALFALLLMVLGLQKKAAPVRIAGLGLLGVTLLKLFVHDLATLGQLYRIGALVVVAIIAIGASFLFQRFFSVPPRSDENPLP